MLINDAMYYVFLYTPTQFFFPCMILLMAQIVSHRFSNVLIKYPTLAIHLPVANDAYVT